MVVLTLLGCKPIVDGYRIVCGVPQAPGQAFDQDISFAYTRFVETSVESIPQVVIQALALAVAKERGNRQYFSLVISCVSIANTVMSVGHDMDTSEHFRAVEPLYYGAIPEGAAGNLVNVALFAFALCYVLAKVIGVAVLFSVSRLAVGVVLAAEFGLFTLVRVSIGNWRYFSPVGDSTVFSIIFHTVLFLIMMAAPFPILRYPWMVTPSVYAGVIAWNLLLSNPGMAAAAFFAFERAPNLASQAVAIALVGVTAGCALAAALGMANVVPTFRPTFYRHRTGAVHMREFWWKRESYMWDGEMQEQEKIRAEILTSYARCYWPTDLVEAFVQEGRARWVGEEPEWFTEEWRARIPPEFTPGITPE